MLKNFKHKRDWKKYLKAQEYCDDYANLSPSEQAALDKYNHDRWARRDKKIDRLWMIIIGIIAALVGSLITWLIS